MAISFAVIDTIWAAYFDSFGLSTSTIGFISAALILISLVVSLSIAPFLFKHKLKTIAISTLLIFVASYIILALTNNLWILLIIATLVTITGSIRINTFDILFRQVTTKKSLTKDEGLLYAIANGGWLIGPIIAAGLLHMGHFTFAFIGAAVFMTIGALILWQMKLRNEPKEKPQHRLNIKSFLQHKNLGKPYIFATGIEMWWALIYVFIPLFMIKQGLSLSAIGFFLSAVIIPTTILEYSASTWATKKGFLPMFRIGFAGLAICAIAAFFVPNIYWQLGLFVLGSVFMALIEPIQDSFFFHKIKQKESDIFFPVFSTAGDIGSLIAKISIAIGLVFAPYQFAYLIMACFMAVCVYASYR